MSAPKLVLYPESNTLAPPGDAIVEALLELGLIGARFTLDDQAHFYTGAEFLAGVSFLGCAPSIQLAPPAPPADRQADARAGRFCHLQLHTATEQPRLRHKPGQPPRCRRCRSDLPAALLQAWTGPSPAGNCPGCGEPIAAAGLNWRQSGGYARLFLDIWGIHTSEAVPSDRLLDRLGQASGGPWGFFYIED